VSHGRVDVGAPEEVRAREGFRLQALGLSRAPRGYTDRLRCHAGPPWPTPASAAC
jgi:hypothetical protein